MPAWASISRNCPWVRMSIDCAGKLSVAIEDEGLWDAFDMKALCGCATGVEQDWVSEVVRRNVFGNFGTIFVGE
jgi:hypothetical protein